MDSNKKILLRVTFVFLALAIVLLIAWNTGPFFYHFSGLRLVNIYSYLQLLTTAYVSFLICRSLGKESFLEWHKALSVRPFFISAIGFLFLGLDDMLSIHENLDKLIHFILRMKETPLTDHIDDVILLMYGIVAVFFIKDFVREFRKHPGMVAFIVCGLFTFFVMSALDFLSNNYDTFFFVFSNLQELSSAEVRHTIDIVSMAEDSFKLLGEAFFLSAFVTAFTNIKSK